MHKRDQQISRIRHEAAEWCIAMSGGEEISQEEKASFAEWITRSPHHLREYAAIETLWEEAAGFGEDLRRDARVVSLFGHQPQTASSPVVKRRFLPLAPVAAALAALFVVGSLWFASDEIDLWDDPPGVAYETMKGETRVISLADGSVMHLNTLSAAAVRYEKGRRLIHLEQGQAYFDVRKDPGRPFIVATNAAEVEAVGTGFDVKAFDSEFAVTVVEGEVVVRGTRPQEMNDPKTMTTVGPRDQDFSDDHAGPRDWSANLRADQQIIIPAATLAKPPQPKPVAARTETAWRENKLIFDGDLLSDVVADFNRYNMKRIVILDDTLRSLRVSGTFDPRAPESFARTMAAAAGLKIEAGLENNIFLRANSS